MTPTLHRAKYVLLHPDLIMENAVVSISNSGHVLEIGSWQDMQGISAAEVFDWGAAVLMPGLINAHAHLELTDLHNRLNGFASFTDWILKLIRERKTWMPEDYKNSAENGAQCSMVSGTTLVGDISSSGVGWNAVSGDYLRRVVFEEVLSLFPERVEPILAQLNNIFGSAEFRLRQIHGISPHAPYSTGSELYSRTAGFARNEKRPLTTHVAETEAELQFLLEGTGEFRDFLTAIGALPDGWNPPQISPIAYLDSLNVLGPACLLVHCNYLDAESIQRIAQSHSSVVYCPRSHSYFGHKKHPIRQLLDSGINVALGTDSLASNYSLSILDEMRHLFVNRKDINPREIFLTATVNGAKALGFGGVLGHLDPGCPADMAVLSLPMSLKPENLLPQILEGVGDCIATIVAGEIVWQKADFKYSGRVDMEDDKLAR
jgi:cytosine/adenosine deaminase-related metal-dependent hydrolase